MICNRCGAELPENSLFCFRCGNRLEQAPAQPQEQKSSSPFGTKTISDKHYSLEDIARQQRESSNEIGFDLSSDRPRRKKKRRPPSQGSQLPSSGTSDRMDPAALAGLSAVQNEISAEQNTSAPESSYQQQTAPSEQNDYAQHITAPVSDDAGTAYQQTSAPEQSDSVQQTTAPVSDDDGTAYQQTSAPEQSDSAQQTPAPVAFQSKAAFRYTITSPPVPLGLQRQVRLRLFGGNISSEIEELRRTYIEKKNNG